MDAKHFARMLSDKYVLNLKKLAYKYSTADVQEFVELLKDGIYVKIPLKDFAGTALVYLGGVTQVRLSAAKALLTPQNGTERFGLKAMEDEIISTLTIESVDFSRDSVRRILKGYAPADESEQRIYGMKKGLEFISDPANKITEQNLHALYQMTVGDFLDEEDLLLPGMYYRHDSVHVVGDTAEHSGLPWSKLPGYMQELIAFIESESVENDLLKAAIIHFYVAYLHPWFDGNGRMARLLHLWYLVQQGYSSALFIPLSEYVEKSRKNYYQAYTLTEQNAAVSGVIDVTPFLVYFIENVYHKLGNSLPAAETTDHFREALASGQISEKEKELWFFVQSAYGDNEFSTKQLEKDFSQAAYATIRGFVLKFTELGLLTSQAYGNRTKYRVK